MAMLLARLDVGVQQEGRRVIDNQRAASQFHGVGRTDPTLRNLHAEHVAARGGDRHTGGPGPLRCQLPVDPFGRPGRGDAQHRQLRDSGTVAVHRRNGVGLRRSCDPVDPP